MDFVVAFATAPLHVILTVAILNALVFASNHFTDHLGRIGAVPYEVGHAWWHLFSCLKSVFVAYLVGCRWGIVCTRVAGWGLD